MSPFCGSTGTLFFILRLTGPTSFKAHQVDAPSLAHNGSSEPRPMLYLLSYPGRLGNKSYLFILGHYVVVSCNIPVKQNHTLWHKSEQSSRQLKIGARILSSLAEHTHNTNNPQYVLGQWLVWGRGGCGEIGVKVGRGQYWLGADRGGYGGSGQRAQ